ncbi:hypothetical protein NLI96_g6173 [Meripilus lineatus]|uniref:FIST domain-containing protein n=1 Tax=Meripilus lineatus TaxID=2056292 RepID=A0AAD5V3C6_9APHY|nr:hypothetical protein NLI96_g6173 [Physisporinus lineatus]
MSQFTDPSFDRETASDLSSVIYLSDSAPEGLTKSLSALTGASQVGFIASSTPFTTGRPFTLFHNTNIYSSGAVGVCIASPVTGHVRVNFPRLQSITESLTVSSSEGNLVHALDESNPSRLLLNAIEKFNSARAEGCLPLDKGDDFYLGVSCGPTSSKDCIHQVYHIISGDPSRGSIALEGEDSPAPGTRVKVRDPFQSYPSPNPNTPISPSIATLHRSTD